jgi:hypothetical protein
MVQTIQNFLSFWAGGLLLLSVPLFADCKSPPPPPQSNVVTVTGEVRIVGSEPHTEVVITDQEGIDWAIPSTSRPLLAPRQGQTLTVRGILAAQDLTLADGRVIGRRRELRDPVILE